MFIERRRLTVSAPARDVYRVFTGIGAARGWYFANWTWRLRGMADRLLGGAGLRRGRRHPDDLRIGDALDFWRVEYLVAGRLMRLRAEMKLPGRAWLQYEVWETEEGETHLEQIAEFIPRGLAGLLYWYALYPVHSWDIRRSGQGDCQTRRTVGGVTRQNRHLGTPHSPVCLGGL